MYDQNHQSFDQLTHSVSNILCFAMRARFGYSVQRECSWISVRKNWNSLTLEIVYELQLKTGANIVVAAVRMPVIAFYYLISAICHARVRF